MGNEGRALTAGRARWRRGAITEFVDRHTFVWETTVAVLTAAYVGLSFFEDGTSFALNPFTITLFALSGLFLIEFGLRYWDAPSRPAYLRNHWLDLVTSFPLIGPFRALRLLRLLRFARLGLSVRKLMLGSSHVSDSWLIWPFILVFWVGSAYALWLAEHAVNPAIRTFNDALLYAFLTACTVGYGSFSPTTIEGKIIAGAIVFVAIGLVGFTSARITALYLGQREDRLPAQLGVIERDIAEIKRLLAHMQHKDAAVAVDVVEAQRD